MNDVQRTIFAIIAQQSGIAIDNVNLESRLEDLGIESLDTVRVIFAIENHYDISLPALGPHFDTQSVHGLIDVVQHLLVEKQTSVSTITEKTCAA